MIIITVVGLLVGFRPSTGVLAYMAGILLILLFAYSLSWGFAVIGLSAPNSETAQVMSFPILFPLTFISSAFVPLVAAKLVRGSPPTSRSRDGQRLPCPDGRVGGPGTPDSGVPDPCSGRSSSSSS